MSCSGGVQAALATLRAGRATRWRAARRQATNLALIQPDESLEANNKLQAQKARAVQAQDGERGYGGNLPSSPSSLPPTSLNLVWVAQVNRKPELLEHATFRLDNVVLGSVVDAGI
jgi:hypothetical protein